MAIDAPVVPERRSGLTTALNVIISPGEAFETLRVAPMWGWAFLISSALAIIGALIAAPANNHAAAGMMQNMVTHSSMFANMTDAQKAQIVADSAHPSAGKQIFGLLFTPIILLIIVLFQTVILLVGNALGGGKATFKQLWCAAMNVAIVGGGLFWLVMAIITVVRGAESFNRPSDLAASVPGLAYLAPHAGPAMASFLGAINVFSIWATVLIAMAMTIIARTSKAIAYSFAVLILVVGACIPAAIASVFTR